MERQARAPPAALAGLGALAQEVVEANAKLRAGVAKARAGGASWEHIGKVLGVTRQAAWERFGSGELQQTSRH